MRPRSACGGAAEKERRLCGKEENRRGYYEDTLAPHSIYRWGTKSQPLVLERREAEGFEPSHNLLTDCSLGWFALPLGYASRNKEWLVVIEISATLFQPARSGSHLYSAPLYPVRSVHRNKVLLALVGTPVIGSPCPPLLYSYYITDLSVCQEFFLIFF